MLYIKFILYIWSELYRISIQIVSIFCYKYINYYASLNLMFYMYMNYNKQ
jgi:hypothetical protein